MHTYTYQLSGLTCEACTKLISRRVGKIPGMTDIKIDVKGNLEVTLNREFTTSELAESLKDTDYKIL